MDIDNTLTQELELNGTSTYQATNGIHTQAFPSTLSTGEVMSTSMGKSAVKLYLWDGVKDAMGPITAEPIEPIVKSTEETPAPEASQVPDAAEDGSDDVQASAESQPVATTDENAAGSGDFDEVARDTSGDTASATEVPQFRLYDSKRNCHLDNAIDLAAEIWNHCIALHRRY